MAAGLVTVVRRALVAVFAGAAIATLIRVRNRGEVPRQTGGWRELADHELA